MAQVFFAGERQRRPVSPRGENLHPVPGILLLHLFRIDSELLGPFAGLAGLPFLDMQFDVP